MKTTKTIIIITVLYLTTTLTNAVVILVPGTFATNATWWQPGGDFFQSLERHAQQHNHYHVPFYWSCSLGIYARLQAAEILAKLILSYQDQGNIVVVGHSHGGNVVNLASQMIHLAKIGPILTAAEPSTSLLDVLSPFSLFRTLDTEITKNDTEEEECAILFNQIVTRLATSLQPTTRNFNNNTDEEEKYLIDEVYLLGTPVDANTYAPNMHTISMVYNLHSKGDMVQPVLGLYDECFQGKKRIVNLQVFLEAEVIYEPNHAQLHDPMIARFLLAIPKLVESKRDKEEMEHDGSIQFYKDKEPLLISHSPSVANAERSPS